MEYLTVLWPWVRRRNGFPDITDRVASAVAHHTGVPWEVRVTLLGIIPRDVSSCQV